MKMSIVLNNMELSLLSKPFLPASSASSQAIAIQCTFAMQIPREKNLQSDIVFRMFLKTFYSRNNALCDLWKVCQLQEQKVSEASDLYRFQKSPKEYVKNLSEVYRKQNDQKNGLL